MTPKRPSSRLLLPVVFLLLAGCRATQPGPAPAPSAATPATSATSATPATSAKGANVAPADVAPADVLELTQRADGPLLLDVRTLEEFASGHVPGAIHIPVDELAGRLAEIEPYRDRGVVTYCKSGRRAQAAVETLRDAGFTNAIRMDGSMDRWLSEHRPVE